MSSQEAKFPELGGGEGGLRAFFSNELAMKCGSSVTELACSRCQQHRASCVVGFLGAECESDFEVITLPDISHASDN